MTRPLRSAVLSALLLPALIAGARADVLYLVDGRTLADVTIEGETLQAVSYKEKGKSELKSVAPDEVLSIEYKRLPAMLDEADGLARDGALLDAVDRYYAFVESIDSGENKRDRQAWAPAYALQRVIECNVSLGDAEGVIQAADALLAKAPDSRHAPAALLAKAEAQKFLARDAQVRQALDDLRAMIDARQLSKRWSLELELAEVLFNPELKGQPKRERLIEIAGQAGKTYPAVANRARVAEGETWLQGEKPDFASARKVFEKILADPKADDTTMAGAYTGMGDCLFHEAATKSQKSGPPPSAELEAALMAYMRVVVNYRDQTGYAPKAMFYAGRALDLLGEDENLKANARRMYAAVIQNYPGTDWAREAQNFRR